MKKIFTSLFLFISIFVSATTVYLNTGGAALWNQAGARFAVYAFNGDDNTWFDMSQVSGDIYSAEISDSYSNIIFCRMNGETTENSWANKWNQTADLTLSDGQDLYTITAWGGEGNPDQGQWGVYDATGGGNQGGNEGGNQGGNEGGNQGGLGGEDGGLEGWFYKGYIDGQDVELSAATRFEQGVVSFACTEKSYLFVIYQDANGGVQYMAQGYQDELEHCTMYPNIEEAGGNRLSFAAGVYTLYLYDNEDGTVELSRVQLPGKKLMGAEVSALGEVKYELDLNAPMYNIIGREVDASYRGIVIQNGRKYIR